MKKVNFKDIIIKETDDYIFVNKPPYIPTLDDRVLGKDNILHMAREYWPDAQVCHRLDKETSGVLAIAKNSEAYRHMAVSFERRNVTKIYHALVNGVHDFQGVDVYLPIHQLSNGTVKIDKINGKEAETIFDTMKVYRLHTLVACFPISGRMHQIRVHLQCLKAPICGDHTYGGKDIYLSSYKKNFNLKMETDEQPLIQRVALHAYSLEFEDLQGNVEKIEAPYPKDFAVLVKQLEKYG